MTYKTFKEQLTVSGNNLRNTAQVDLTEDTLTMLKEHLGTLDGKELEDELIFILDYWAAIKNDTDIKIFFKEKYYNELIAISENSLIHRGKTVAVKTS